LTTAVWYWEELIGVDTGRSVLVNAATTEPVVAVLWVDAAGGLDPVRELRGARARGTPGALGAGGAR
jgi:hypothetical protein